MTLFNDLTWAEASEDEITIADVDQKLGADGVRRAAVIYNRLIQHLGSVALTISVGARRKWIRSLENTGAPLQPVDPYEGAPTHVAGYGAWQDQKGPGLPNAREQMGRMGKQAGEGLQGEDERHGEDWDLHQHGSRTVT